MRESEREREMMMMMMMKGKENRAKFFNPILIFISPSLLRP